ncbi:MAG TPA: hypothetical protein VGG10_03360 [Rhizomicrobium sp.]|jgi:hypothetical protein
MSALLPNWLRRLAARPPQGPLWQDAKAVAADPEKRLLWLIGNPLLARRIVTLTGARGTFLASSPAIANALQDLAADGCTVACAAFETAPHLADYDLCIVCPAPEQIPDLYEDWLSGPIARALKPGGAALLPVPRDMAAETLAQLPAREDAAAALRAFGDFHFAGTTPIDGTANRFSADAPFAFDIVEPTEAPLVWIRIVKRPEATLQPKPVFLRSQQPDRFPMREFKLLMGRLENRKVRVLPTANFARRFAALANPRESKGFGILKFDIHRGIHRAEEMARILTGKSLPGLFLMMHRHDANAAYYDHEETWNVLRNIQSMGHEIGLHLDPFDLVRRHGDLLAATAEAADDLRRRGLAIESATLHGDTRNSIRARKLRALDFFEEGAHVSTWDGAPPEGDETLTEHFGRYTLAELKEKTGIRFLVETTFGNDGTMIKPFVPLYLSDNTRSLRFSGPKRQRLRGVEPFRITPAVARNTAMRLREQPFLALFHPQWYW